MSEYDEGLKYIFGKNLTSHTSWRTMRHPVRKGEVAKCWSGRGPERGLDKVRV